MTIVIRPETPEDFIAIDQINDAAFGETAQSRIIRELRDANEVLCSKVLEKDGQLIGHLLVYRVLIDC